MEHDSIQHKSQIRLEAVRLALTTSGGIEQVIENARRISEFVLTGAVPETPPAGRTSPAQSPS